MEERKYALLIDADNVSPKYLSIILDEAKSYGIVSIRRIYGDWTDASKRSWKNRLVENSLIPIQQYSYTTGKNSSDSAMIIDAMDILYTASVDGFFIVSSDSDFTRLAMRLREAGKFVIGMGESKTPESFVKSVGEFKTLDVLFQNTLSAEEQEEEIVSSGNGTAVSTPQTDDAKPITSLKKIRKSVVSIIEKNSDDEGKMMLSDLGRLLTNRYPDFDARNYGKYHKFSEFVRSLKECHISMVAVSGKQKQAYVSLSERS